MKLVKICGMPKTEVSASVDIEWC